MGDQTGIEWTDATWNPVTGCTKVSQGCKHCYAERMFPRAYAGSTAYDGTPRKFTDVRTHPERLDMPLRWRRPRRIFVNSMSDLFHEDVPADFIDEVFAVMAVAKWHTFQILTKRPERMDEYMHELYAGAMYGIATRLPKELAGFESNAMNSFAAGLPHVWLGVSAEDQATFDARVELLGRTQAAVRWVSAEPLLGPIDCGNAFDDPPNGSEYGKVDWVVVGGESGPHARPMHPDWARTLRDQCVFRGVRFLFKQWGEWVPMLGHTEGVPVHGAKFTHPDGVIMGRAGKKAAGRTLDGVTWDQYPA